MDKFRVGQMVRKVRLAGDVGELPIGTIGCITDCVKERCWLGKFYFGYGTDTVTPGGYIWTPREDLIELIYDGDQPASWEDCAWKPEKIKA